MGQEKKTQGVAREHRVRSDGWTPLRQRAFLRALTEMGCVSDACKKVQVSTTSAYRLRAKSAEFAAAWAKAQKKGWAVLEEAAYTRAVEGWDGVVEKGGEVVSRKRRYSDSLLRLLVQRGDLQSGFGGMTQEEKISAAHRAAEAAGGQFWTVEADRGAGERLEKKLMEMAERLDAGTIPCPNHHPCPTCDGAGRIDDPALRGGGGGTTH
ncbi:hypothetical protein [Sphingomonas xinjiangensis]|uniref:Terminase small subunit n=1 Tax=Sphingomonas xinjiangensis TaxID=643568 RepID=A0A840YP37_9SPHN|nr:hypothetical protein [Sphingomonas xinjiangensis]MBB5711910.1 hypothetical protein [Sphingomonas xinjiangensis]